MDFEKKLEKLEQISELMREDTLDLDQSIKSFEDGIKLAEELEKELNQFEKRVQILTEKNGEDHLEDFE